MEKVKDIKDFISDIKFKYIWKLVIVLTLLVVTCGCQNRWINYIGTKLDNMAQGREKFGTISFSEPILMESKRDQPSPFDFTLMTGPDNYYKDARNIFQGKMTSSSQLIKDTGVDLSMQGDISGMAADTAKLKQYEQKLAALDAQNKLFAEARDLEAQKVIAALPDDATEEKILEARAKAAKIRAGEEPITIPESPASTPTQPSNDITVPSTEDSSKNMTGFFGLLAGTPDLKISNRSAINTAAGDTVTEAIFTLLGNPAKTAQFKDKLMLFGVSMVSITPGYVTKEGYAGELFVSCSYYYEIARRDLLEKIKKVEEGKGNKGDKRLIELIEMAIKKEGPKWEESKSTEKEQQRTASIEASKKEKGKNIKSKALKIEQKFIDKHIPQRYQKEFREGFTPLAAAVSPMTDVDALDLSSSIRNQAFTAMKISAALSYAGLTGKAKVFDNWARKLEQDTQTRTSYAAVTSFSVGRHFGFRIRPRLKAIKDESSIFKTPGYVLEDQAFPVAVIVGFDTDDLKIAFDFERRDDGGIKRHSNGKTRLIAYEPTIEFHQTINWIPNKEVSLWDIVNLRCLWNKLNRNELTERKRLKWLDIYTKEKEEVKALKKSNFKDPNYYLYKYVSERLELLSDQILGTSSTQYLPMVFLVGKPVKEIPEVNEPNNVFERWYDAPSTYVIKGKNFEGQVVGANIEGQPCKVEVVGDNITLITSPGWTPKPDEATAKAEKQIAQAKLDIAKANKRINDAQKSINDANEILKQNSKNPSAINKKKKAESDLNKAKSDLAIAEANIGKAEADKRLAMVQTTTSKKLQIDLITTKGSIKAGFVHLAHQTTPAKTKTLSSDTSKTDTTLTITRNAANKILTISAKGDSKEVDKLISIVKEGEKAGANVDLKLNASGQMDVKTDTNRK